jgi:hypothetical protein
MVAEIVKERGFPVRELKPIERLPRGYYQIL